MKLKVLNRVFHIKKEKTLTFILSSFVVLLVFIPLLTCSQIPNHFLFSSNPYQFPPQILNASVHPSKVHPGDLMTISASVSDPYGINSVQAKIQHEKGFDLVNLTLTSGTIYNGTWQSQWKVHDTITKNYTTTITAYSESGLNSSTNLTWQDPLYVEVNLSDYTVSPGQQIQVYGNINNGTDNTTNNPISIYLDGNLLANSSTNSFGNYNYTFSAPLTAGTHTVKVNLTEASLPVPLTVVVAKLPVLKSVSVV
jgi:hypothetical protein